MSLLTHRGVVRMSFGLAAACILVLGMVVFGSPEGSAGSSDDREAGVALVAEEMDGADAGRYTGLFGAHWESDSGDRFKEGPQSVSVAEALEWARERSNVVLVQIGGDDEHQYSAGERPVTDGGTVPWPPGGIEIAARPEGSPLDGSQQIVLWRVDATLDAPTEVVEQTANRMSSDPSVEAVSVSRSGLRIVIHARGSKAAALATLRIADSAYAATSDADGATGVSLSIDDVARSDG